jgi:hypothetical protein
MISLVYPETTLAEQTSDPNGQAMFQRLAEEEHANRRVLEDAYWSDGCPR